MTKISRDQFIQLVNAKAKEHTEFVDGMHAFLATKGPSAEHPSGYEFEPPNSLALQWAAGMISKDYVIGGN